MHAAVNKPDVLPYRPALQLLQVPAPPKLYFPCPHIVAVAVIDPATHAYPAVHGPLHDALVSPDVAPNVPAGHALHTPAPASEYCPATHMDAVGDTLPSTHAYPAVHSPLQAELASPATAP